MSTYEILCDANDRDKWLALRQELWTATASAPLLGLGDDSADVTIKDKALRTEADPKLRELAMVVAGNHMEPGIISWYAAESPLPVESFGKLLRSKPWPWMGATPDAVRTGGKLVPLECKNVAFDSGWNWHRGSQPKLDAYAKLGIGEYPAPDDVNARVAPIVKKVAKDAEGPKRLWREHMVSFYVDILPRMGPLSAPVKYYCQLQWQIGVLGASEGVIVVCMGGVNRFDLTYRRNDTLIDLMVDESHDAWKVVEKMRIKLDSITK